ncbi:bifunctional polynucleotide phosphatase/kinase-like [Physella acuta]|uniref:bifunctional polynucleotide phosphatase/kinase-like n=1 Tax=Physella acuta TaxID=109671 RepID=UPI0027DE78A0|nr:bifunctional polynucleotide phosphatase/kinase-like [Physella acuta]XP_059140399.1 bifunctional polynucleotide phosphatase/kinase-like [Physella acuta]
MSSRPKRKAVTDSEVKAKKLRGETDLCDGLHWSNVGTDSKGVCPLLITLTSDSLEGRSKVASFDIDFTIIKTASGRKFATGPKDWTFWDPSVTEKLKALDKDGHRIVFFTNQGGIEKLKVTPEGFKDKIEDILKQLGIPVLVFASTGNNQYRKPSTSMWDYFEEKCNKGVKVKKNQSIYVGDAAGRKKGWAKDKPKDFSCSDRMFAANIGIKFATPEEFFLGEKHVPFQWGSLDPNKFLSSNPPAVHDKTTYASKKQELIVMVGQPASGKSTFSKRYLVPHGYTTVNRDTLGTMEKCVKMAKEALEKGKSVVSDNTNPSVDGRAKFINLAKEKGVPCRCLWLQTPNELSHHLNLYRQTLTNGQVRRIPDVGYNVFKKNFEEPTTSEGFSEVIKVQFQPEFDSKTDEQLFRKWTV